MRASNALTAVTAEASRAYGSPGGHVGWNETGQIISARPRGGVLVLGPPGSGKSSAVIIPSVWLAPGACVSTSIKGDVMKATMDQRAHKGQLWHFDPGGDEPTAPGVVAARWSPLVSVKSWDDARRVASRMVSPARGVAGGTTTDSPHFTDKAQEWIEVLLYAAHLAGVPISQVADWAVSSNEPLEQEVVLAVLIEAEEAGDDGAVLARQQYQGLLFANDRERSGYITTMTRLLRVYFSLTARRLGDDPNFDPVAFVRSTDTLYITASPERQTEYAPLIAALLEEIRYAVYARHRACEEGRDVARPHVTFVLDEANNTAQIPLPQIISEAGGQSLHIIVGIQDLSRARARWGKEADGLLTLFPTKLVLPGIVEQFTLEALSQAAGEYDRQMVGKSQSTAFLPWFNIPFRMTNRSYSLHRQRVLTPGDIASPPPGKATLWDGARWALVNIGMHWQHPVWRLVTATPPPAAALPAAAGHAITQKGTP